MNKHIKIVAMQLIFLALVLAFVYFMYPKAEVNVKGNIVNFKSINAKVIAISEAPDFSNPKYIELNESYNFSFILEPGTYYWKADNGLISGFKNEFKINSEVGMKINKKENESELKNIGNVKINVTRTKEGVMVGRIILEPDEAEKIEDETGNKYIGREG